MERVNAATLVRPSMRMHNLHIYPGGLHEVPVVLLCHCNGLIYHVATRLWMAFTFLEDLSCSDSPAMRPGHCLARQYAARPPLLWSFQTLAWSGWIPVHKSSARRHGVSSAPYSAPLHKLTLFEVLHIARGRMKIGDKSSGKQSDSMGLVE